MPEAAAQQTLEARGRQTWHATQKLVATHFMAFLSSMEMCGQCEGGFLEKKMLKLSKSGISGLARSEVPCRLEHQT